MLNKRKVFDDVNILSDVDIKFLLAKLKSENDLDILYALDFLGKLENKEFEDELKILLKNKNPQIRPSWSFIFFI